MRVLMYEPGSVGHRPVIRRYTEMCFDRAGIDWVAVTEDLSRRPWELVRRATTSHCDIIYIITVDGISLFAWTVSILGRRTGIRVVANYYLFNNLKEGWKSLAWRAILATGGFERLWISDDFMKENDSGYPGRVAYLPDPWDPADFKQYTMDAARARLSIDDSDIVYLMFGLLNRKKGAELLLRSLREIGYADTTRRIHILMVGNASQEVKKQYRSVVKELANAVTCSMVDDFVQEKDVSAYFYACNYVVVASPKWFKVSSGCVTRSFAAARPVIVPCHGVNHRLVEAHDCGLSYRSEDSSSLARCLEGAARMLSVDKSRYRKLCDNAKRLGQHRCLQRYGSILIEYFGNGKYERYKGSNNSCRDSC